MRRMLWLALTNAGRALRPPAGPPAAAAALLPRALHGSAVPPRSLRAVDSVAPNHRWRLGAGSSWALSSSSPSSSSSSGETGRGAEEVAGADTSSELTNPFHDAVERGDVEAVLAFLDTGEDINGGDPARANTSAMHLASRRGFSEVVDLLAARGAKVNVRGAWELTPLHYAAVFGHAHVAEALLGHGADPSLRDVQGRTALDRARMERNEDVAVLLEAALEAPR